MKITKKYLKQIIKENLEQIKNESEDDKPIQGSYAEPYYKRHLERAKRAVEQYLPEFEEQGVNLQKVYSQNEKEILSHLADSINQSEYGGGRGLSRDQFLVAFLKVLIK